MEVQKIKTWRAWDSFLQQEAASLALTKGGRRNRQRQLIVHLRDGLWDKLKIYGTAPTLHMLGKAAPRLAKHAGVPLLFCGHGELAELGLALSPRARLARFVKPFKQYNVHKLPPLADEEIVEGDESGIFCYTYFFAMSRKDAPGMILCPNANDPWGQQQWTKYFFGHTDFSKHLLTANDFFMMSLAHEASHARQMLLPDQPLLEPDELSRFRCEVDADKGALEFVAQNRDLFDAPYSEIKRAWISMRRISCIVDADIKHATYLALGCSMLDRQKLEKEGALQDMLDDTTTLHDVMAHRLYLEGFVTMEERPYFSSHQEKYRATAFIAQELLDENHFQDQPRLTRILQDFVADITDLAPHFCPRRNAPGQIVHHRMS